MAEYKSGSKHRKWIFRLMVLIVVCKALSHVVKKGMTWRRKRILAQSASLALVLILVCSAIFQPEKEPAVLMSKETVVMEEVTCNVVEGGDSSAHLGLNTSRVQLPENRPGGVEPESAKSKETAEGLQTDERKENAGDKNRKKNQVIQNSQNDSEKENNVVQPSEKEVQDNYSVMSLIQGKTVDHGRETEVSDRTLKYQKPVDEVVSNPYREMVLGSLPDHDIEKTGGRETGGAVSGGACSVSGEAVSAGAVEAAVPETETSSVAKVSELAFLDRGEQKLSAKARDIYCTNHTKLEIEPDPELGVTQYHCLYGVGYTVLFAQLDTPNFLLPNDFYGSVLVGGTDEEGRMTALGEKCYLIEDHEPEIRYSAGRVCTAPYMLWVDVLEPGQMVSGIQSLTCKVNGDTYELADMDVVEYTSLGDSLEVPSKCHFPVVLQQEGTYDVEITAVDYAGNRTVKSQKVVVSKPELVSVYMQNQFTIHIDPQQLQKREQIYTDDIRLVNTSEFDVNVKIDQVTLSVKDEKTADGVKDCTVYLVAPDTGEKIKLSKGNNKNPYAFTLSSKETKKEGALRFVGDVTEHSDKMWKDSDISIDIQMSFEKAE